MASSFAIASGFSAYGSSSGNVETSGKCGIPITGSFTGEFKKTSTPSLRAEKDTSVGSLTNSAAVKDADFCGEFSTLPLKLGTANTAGKRSVLVSSGTETIRNGIPFSVKIHWRKSEAV